LRRKHHEPRLKLQENLLGKRVLFGRRFGKKELTGKAAWKSRKVLKGLIEAGPVGVRGGKGEKENPHHETCSRHVNPQRIFWDNTLKKNSMA